MIIKENINKLKNIINENKFIIIITFTSSLMLPTILVLNFIDIIPIEYLNYMDSLWIGFYNCIFLIYFIDSGLLNEYKIILIPINIIAILFIMVFSLMDGLQGLIITTIKMILPFIPYDWVVNFTFSVLGYTKP